MTPAPRPRVPWSHGDKFLMVTLGLVALLVIGFGLWFHALDVNPTVSIPTPAMPTVNARDYYIAAGNAVKDDSKISYVNWQPPQSTGGPPGHSPTSAGGPTRTFRPAPVGQAGDEHIYSPAQKAALVAENIGAIQTLKTGLTYPYQEMPSRTFFATYPHYATIRGLARLLALQAQVKAAQGDWNGSMDADLDAVQMGEELPHGGTLIGMLVGDACQANGRRQAWGTAEHLNASEVRGATQRLEHILARHVPFADTLQTEAWGTEASLQDLMQQKDWARNFLSVQEADEADGGQSNAALGRWLAAERIRFTGKRTIMNNYRRYMAQEITNARQPYAAHPTEPIAPADPVNEVLLPVFVQSRLRETVADTQNALLLTVLALHAYKLEHGVYPASLSALVPGYLTAVPTDPFALSGPLRYKPQGATYLLYSVGPDGKDDGGRAIFDATQSPSAPGSLTDRRRYIKENSAGDIVAGVNVN